MGIAFFGAEDEEPVEMSATTAGRLLGNLGIELDPYSGELDSDELMKAIDRLLSGPNPPTGTDRDFFELLRELAAGAKSVSYS